MIKLIFETGVLAGHRFAVDHDVTLGRDPSNDMTVPDAAVSLVHCRIGFKGRRAYVTDLGSTNGVRVNGLRAVQLEIRDGDTLLIGKNRIRVEWIGPQPTHYEDTGITAYVEPESEVLPGELSGDIFGSVTYHLRRRIASGGMGAIYEAEQFGAEGFIKKVAIKTILPSFVKKESFVSSFIGEAKLVANLVHPNIVQIHHLGRHGKGYYIAMEYLDGIDLGRLIAVHARRRTPLALDLALMMMQRVCDGLHHAHTKTDEDGHPLGLVHRDVSPSNIMVSRDGEVKLTDFGVAKAAQFMEDDGDYLVGSVEYMSPEQAACQPVDARSDIFSLGLVGYELLTGVRVFRDRRQPFDDDPEAETQWHVEDVRTHRPDLPLSVVELIVRCLRVNPGDRYPSAAELGAAIETELYKAGRIPTAADLARHLSGVGLARKPAEASA